MTVKWRGKPVFIRHRTEKEIELARADDSADLRDPETDAVRVKDPKYLGECYCQNDSQQVWHSLPHYI